MSWHTGDEVWSIVIGGQPRCMPKRFGVISSVDDETSITVQLDTPAYDGRFAQQLRLPAQGYFHTREEAAAWCRERKRAVEP